MKIITNTAALMTPEEGKRHGIEIIPVSVSMQNRSLRDYIDISPDEFVEMIKGEEIPVSSQPAVGDVLDALKNCDEDIIMITVAHGLSGEYMTAMGLRESLDNRESIHVVNSKSLAGPLRHMAFRAAELKEAGASADEVLAKLKQCVDSTISFVIPADFTYLRKSGRITNLTSKIGGALRLLPVLTQSENRQRIVPVSIKRTWKASTKVIIDALRKKGVNSDYLISICHADNPSLANQVAEWINQSFENIETEVLQLSPSLITHGGPGCIVVQAVLK